jgi:hypothetical protein
MANENWTWCVIGAGTWGLYYGQVDFSPDAIAKAMKDGTVFVKNCRNIRVWYGAKGGITSLAAFGPRVEDDRNRIGSPTDGWIGSPKNFYTVPKEAQKKFDAIKNSPV